MRYEIYCKDFNGNFMTVHADRKNGASLTDLFEFASYRTFGAHAIGCKECHSKVPTLFIHKHGDVTPGIF